MYLAAPSFHRKRMPQLMKGLGERKNAGDQNQVFERQNLVGDIRGQRRPVYRRLRDGRPDDYQPQDAGHAIERQGREEAPPVQPTLRIEYRELDRQGTAPA